MDPSAGKSSRTGPTGTRRSSGRSPTAVAKYDVKPRATAETESVYSSSRFHATSQASSSPKVWTM